MKMDLSHVCTLRSLFSTPLTKSIFRAARNLGKMRRFSQVTRLRAYKGLSRQLACSGSRSLLPAYLLYLYRDSGGGDTICNNLQGTDAALLVSRHIEMRGHQARICHGHTARIMRPAVEDVPRGPVGDPHEREVRGSL